VTKRLDRLADDIHRALADADRSAKASHEAMFRAGRALSSARAALKSDQAFGAWLREQNFGSTSWLFRLRQAAEHEPAMRESLTRQREAGRTPSFRAALAEVTLPTSRPPVTPPRGQYATILADAPWPFRDDRARGAAARHYATMTVDEIADLVVPAAKNAHLYLWTPVAHLLDGSAVRVMEAWGFRPTTMITWAKAGLGQGHYWRSNTEHLVFGVRGSLPPLDRGVRNWFEAPRTTHSAKPEIAMDLIERVSPGPRIELFARRPARPGWDVWGDEAQDQAS